jgi:hypothetical protein
LLRWVLAVSTMPRPLHLPPLTQLSSTQ